MEKFLNYSSENSLMNFECHVTKGKNEKLSAGRYFFALIFHS